MEQENQTLTNQEVALFLTDVAYKTKCTIPIGQWNDEKIESLIVQGIYDTYQNFMSLLEAKSYV